GVAVHVHEAGEHGPGGADVVVIPQPGDGRLGELRGGVGGRGGHVQADVVVRGGQAGGAGGDPAVGAAVHLVGGVAHPVKAEGVGAHGDRGPAVVAGAGAAGAGEGEGGGAGAAGGQGDVVAGGPVGRVGQLVAVVVGNHGARRGGGHRLG